MDITRTVAMVTSEFVKVVFVYIFLDNVIKLQKSYVQ